MQKASLVSATSPPNIGDAAPEFDLPPSTGTPRLADQRGRPIVIAFHSPHWDPALAEQIEQYKSSLSHSASNCPAASFFLRNDDEVAAVYGVTGRTAVFVIDEDGLIAWRHLAGSDPLPRVEVGSPSKGEADAGDTVATSAFDSRCSRRQFVAIGIAAALAVALSPTIARASTTPAAPAPLGVGDPRPVTLEVNGRAITLNIEPRVTLLDALREYAGLTGSKKGCDHGQCGACTVHVDGRRVLSCLTLAMMTQGKQITTIEGLARGEELHPLQQAFIDHDGFQCGYCTPGQIMSAAAMLHEQWGPSDADVREAMSGNICRCGAYVGIVAAIQDTRRHTGGQSR